MADFANPASPGLGAGAPSSAEPPSSSLRRTIRWIGWGWFAFMMLIFFTILKLPEDRIRVFIQGSIASVLSEQGIGFTATQGAISMFRVSYILKDVTFTFPSGEAIKVDQMAFSPAILPLFTGWQGGTLRVEQGGGDLTASFSMKKGAFKFSYDASAIDIGKIGILSAMAGVKGSAVLSGAGEATGEIGVPSSFSGHADLTLSKITIDQQPVMGFPIPKISVSDAKADISAEKGKATIKTLRIGKPGNPADDLRANLVGDVALSRSWPTSTLNLRADFGISENILKSLSLLEMVLAQGKQADGTYAFTMTGPIGSLMLAPVSTAGTPPAGASR